MTNLSDSLNLKQTTYDKNLSAGRFDVDQVLYDWQYPIAVHSSFHKS